MRTIDRRLIEACKNGDTLTVEQLLQQGANPNAQHDRLSNPTTPLLIAAKNGHIPIIALLIEHGADPHTTDHDGRSALHHALEKRYHNVAQYLITQLQLNPNTKDIYGYTPFLIATLNGDIDILQLLAQHGANPHIPDDFGQTALHHALFNQNHDIARYLITELNLDPNRKDQQGRTPLMLASANGDIKIIQLLIQHGADPYTTDHNGQNALHYAAYNGRDEAAQYLITHLQLDPNTQDRRGVTPFLFATQRKDIRMLQLLVQHGANPNTTDHKGQTALHHALKEWCRGIAQYLITQIHINLNIQDHRGYTPFLIATQNNDIEILQLLAQHGADPNMTDQHGQTALHYALEKRYRDIAQYLITQTHINLNIQDQRGYTPFLIATLNGDIDILQLLAQHGADPHITDHQGRSALHYALEKRYHNIAQYLITQLQLNPNTRDHNGNTPFLLAVKNGDIHMLQLLIQHGADPYVTDHQGRNALHYALEKRYHNIAQYLLTQIQIDPNSQDHEGSTPFLIATQNGDIKMLRLLIQHGANPYVTDQRGRTALHHAVKKYRHNAVEYLMTQLQLDPNQQDHDGNTPLLIATEYTDKRIANTLIQLGAHPHIPNHQGETPASIAYRRIRLPKPQPSTITL